MIFCIKNNCNGKTKVMETRGLSKNNHLSSKIGGNFRRRKCLECEITFVTEEVLYENFNSKSIFTEKRIEYEK